MQPVQPDRQDTQRPEEHHVVADRDSRIAIQHSPHLNEVGSVRHHRDHDHRVSQREVRREGDPVRSDQVDGGGAGEQDAENLGHGGRFPPEQEGDRGR